MDPKVYYCVHKSPPLVSILSQVDPTHTIPSHPISLWSISILSTYLRLGLPSGLFPSGFPTNILYPFLFSSIRAKWPAHLILLDLIILLYLARSTSYEAPRYAVYSNLLSLHLSSVQILFSTPCSQTPSVYVPRLISETMFRTHTEQQAKLQDKYSYVKMANISVRFGRKIPVLGHYSSQTIHFMNHHGFSSIVTTPRDTW
jgi:hypothetical protein